MTFGRLPGWLAAVLAGCALAALAITGWLLFG